MRAMVMVMVAVACHAAGSGVSAAPSAADNAPPSSAPQDDREDPSDTLLPSAADAGASGSPRSALVAEAHRELGAIVESHYAHRTHIVEAEGIFDYDCSGFVDYALGRAAPSALHALIAATRARPLAEDFAAFLASPRAPWRRVERAADLVPGDVIAWREPAEKQSRNTGHVMIVERAPRPGEHAGEVIVGVIDSSHSGHGADDARNRNHRNGLGAGELVLVNDRAGHPTGYRWSPARRSVAYSTEVALGHLP